MLAPQLSRAAASLPREEVSVRALIYDQLCSELLIDPLPPVRPAPDVQATQVLPVVRPAYPDPGPVLRQQVDLDREPPDAALEWATDPAMWWADLDKGP